MDIINVKLFGSFIYVEDYNSGVCELGFSAYMYITSWDTVCWIHPAVRLASMILQEY